MVRSLINLMLIITSMCLIVIIFLGIFFSSLDTEALKEQMADAAKNASGKWVFFEGSVTRSLFPLGLEAKQVVIRDTVAYGPEPMLSIDSIRFRLDPWSLISGTPKINGIELIGVTVKVAMSATGTVNWLPETRVQKQERDGVTALEEEAPLLVDQKIIKNQLLFVPEAVATKDAKILFQNYKNGATWTLVFEDWEAPVPSGAGITLNFKGILAREEGGNPSTITLASLLRYNDTNIFWDISALSLQAREPGTNILQLDFAGSLGLLVTPSMKSIAVNDIKGRLNSTVFSGFFAVLFAGSSNMDKGRDYEIRGDLTADSLDVDQIKTAIRTVWPDSRTTQNVLAAKEKPRSGKPSITLEKTERDYAIATVYADVLLRVHRLVLGGVHGTGMTISSVLNEGTLKTSFSGETHGGTAGGTLEGRLASEEPTWSLEGTMKGMKAEQLPWRYAREGRIRGRIDMAYDISAKGWRNVAPTLAGTISATLEQGEVQGFSLVSRETDAASNIPQTFSRGQASLSGRIRSGILGSSNIRFSSSEMEGTGTLSLDLPKENVTLRLVFRPTASGISVPVTISGPFIAPRYSVDTSKFRR